MDEYYSAVKRLLLRHNMLIFETSKEYEEFMRDLATIFEI